MNAQTLNQKLAAYRVRHSLSLREMAGILRVTSGSTIKNWENGDDIPGPASLLLEWLIDGVMPFDSSMLSHPLPPAVQDAIWNVSMNLEAWEKLDSMRVSGGFATVTDWIAAMIQEELHSPSSPRGLVALSAEDTTPPPVTELRQDVEYERPLKKKKP